MSYSNRKIIVFFNVLIGLLIFGCTSNNAEELYQTNDGEARQIYNSELKEVIENKCISCHIFHLEGTNRYDNFEKTKSSISQMLARISSNTNIIMPPADSSQLTAEEKALFQQFFNALFSTTPKKKVEVTWTAYKFQDFENRAGVSGNFKELTYQLNTNYTDPIAILNNAMVTINTASVNVGNDSLKTQNVGVFFSSFTPQIIGVVDSYTDENALITFSMNGISKQVEFDITVQTDKIVLNGSIPDLSLFNWQTAYDLFNAVCGDLHEQKLWEDVTVQIDILLD